MSCDAFSELGDTYMLESESPQTDLTASLVTRTQSLLLNSRPITGPRNRVKKELNFKFQNKMIRVCVGFASVRSVISCTIP